MGVNYFAEPIPSEDQQFRIAELANEGDYKQLAAELAELEPVHIGKASKGYAFLFNHNHGRYYEKTPESIDEFLMGCIIVDHHGNQISREQLWLIVDAKKSDLVHYTDEVCAGLVFCEVSDFS